MKYPPTIAFMVLSVLASINGRAVPQSTASASAAIADRNQFPKEDWGYFYYLDLDPWVGERRNDLRAAIKLMVCSSSLQPIVETTMPQELPGTSLMRIDLRELGWDYEDWREVLMHNPYFRGGFTMLVRADWLLVQLSDLNESDAYHRLLFGGKEPVKTRDDILAKLGVVNERRLTFGMIEGQSGVAKQGTRWVENRPILRGYAWGTRDSVKLTAEKDPLEHPDGSQVHDAEEWIVGVPKMSMTGLRGALQVYFLTNGQGQLVRRAPVDIVEDATQFRGYREIRAPGSCIQCHETGLNAPTRNEFRERATAGVTAFASDLLTARELQAFHLSDVGQEITHNNDAYQTIVELVTGMSSQQVSAAFKRVVMAYDAPLDMQTAAEEFARHGYDVKQVVAALEFAANTGAAGARLSGLARNQLMPRKAFEQQYLLALAFIEQRSESQ